MSHPFVYSLYKNIFTFCSFYIPNITKHSLHEFKKLIRNNTSSKLVFQIQQIFQMANSIWDAMQLNFCTENWWVETGNFYAFKYTVARCNLLNVSLATWNLGTRAVNMSDLTFGDMCGYFVQLYSRIFLDCAVFLTFS